MMLVSGSATHTRLHPAATTATSFARSSFFSGALVPKQQHSARPPSRAPLEIVNFKFLKDLGLKKPAFLPDFGLEKRKAVLDKFFTSFDAATLDEVIADNLKVYEADEPQEYSKADWINLITTHLKPAIPDFSWSHLATGEKDDAGFSIARIQAVGHHTGKPYTPPKGNYPPVEPTQQRVRLPEQTVKVKVEDGKVTEVNFLLKQGGVPLAFYRALGGKAPAT